MNELKSKKLFNYLQHLDGREDLRTQIDRLYIHCAWNERIYDKRSWKGWVVKLLENPANHYDNSNKAFKVFQDAALYFVQTRPDFKEKFPDNHVQIYDQLLKARLTQPSVPDLQATPEIERLQAQQKTYAAQKEEQEKKAKIAEKRQNSLLRLSPQDQIDLPNEALEMLFGDPFKGDPAAALHFLEKFLERHPEHAVEQWKLKIKELRDNLQNEGHLNQLFSPQGDALSPAERDQKLKAMSKQAVDALLQNGRHAMLLSYGPRELSVDSLGTALRSLPKAAFEKLPPFLKEALKDDQAFDTKRVVARILSHIALDLKSKLGKVDTDPQKLSLIFGNEERQIPAPIAAILPEVIEQTLNECLQGGILGSAAKIMPDGLSAASLHWLAMNGQALLEAPTDQALLKELELRIGALLEKQLTETLKTVNKSFTAYEHNINTVLPPALVQTLGLDGLLSSGPLWLEFEKQVNGLFSLNVYASGMALNLHPLNLAKNVPYAAYRLKDIPQSRLTEPFFHSLLSRHVEPLWNKMAGSRARDIYQGPLQTLGGTVVPNQSDDYLGDLSKPATPWQLALNTLLKGGGKCRELELRLNALLQLCQPHLQGIDKVLRLSKGAEQRAIAQAVASLEREIALFRNDVAMKERLIQIDATLEEVKGALHTADNEDVQEQVGALKSAFDPELLSKALGSAGITLERLDRWRSTLRWAFGNETGELADFIVENMRNVVPAKDPNPIVHIETPLEERFGWGFTSYLSLYNAFFRMVLDLIFTALATQFRDAINAIRGPILSYVPYIFPPAVEKWVSQTIEIVKLLLAKIILTAIWKIAILTPWGKELDKTVAGIKKNIKGLKQSLSGEAAIDVTLEADYQIPVRQTVSLRNKDSILIDSIPLEHTFKPEFPSSQKTPTSVVVQLPWYEFYNIAAQIMKADTALKIIEEINYSAPDKIRRGSFYSLLKIIHTWEIPENGKPGMWDAVENPENVVAALHRLAIKLWDNAELAFEDRKRGDIVVALYTLYAIAARLESRSQRGVVGTVLSLRNKTQATKVEVNAYPLAKWYGTYGATIEDPHVNKRMKQLFACFFPDINLRAIPSNEELDKRAASTLFFYDERGGKTNLEQQLLDRMANKVQQKELFEHYYPTSLRKDEISDLLFTEGFQLHPSDEKSYRTITPAPFNQLRQISFLCFNAVRDYKFQCCHNSSCKNHIPLYRQKNCISEGPDSWETSSSFQSFDEGMSPFRTRIPEFGKALNQAGDLPYLLVNNPPIPSNISLRPEEEIVSSPIKQEDRYQQPWIRDLDTQVHQQEKEIMFASPEERIPLTLAFYLKHRKQLILYPSTSGIYFRNVLLAPGALEQFLTTTPDGAKQLGEFFAALLEAQLMPLSEIFFWGAWMGIRIKGMVNALDPKYSAAFPSFEKAFEDYRKLYPLSPSEHHTLLSLEALDALIDRNDPYKITRLFSEAHLESSSGGGMMGDVIDKDFQREFVHWIPQMQRHFTEPTFRNQVLDKILEKKQLLTQNLIGKEWIMGKGLLSFKKGNLVFSLLRNVVQDSDNSHVFNRLEYVSEKLRPIFQFSKQGFFNLRERADGTFYFPFRPNYKIELHRNRNGEYQIELSYKFKEKVYNYSGLNRGLSYWKSEDGSHLVMEIRTSSIEEVPSFSQDPASLPIKQKGKIALEGYRKGLEPLSRFVPLDQLTVEAFAGEKEIAAIAIPSYKLNFEVSQGKLESKEYPGFFIAPVQIDSALKGFSAYLILENSNGERKVLLPYNQWTSAIAWRGFKQLGPIGDYLNRMINLNSLTPEKLEVGEGVAVYDISKAGSKTQLVSRDPCHLAYLLTLNVLQGNSEEAEKNFRLLEWLCNSQQLPKEVWNHLLPLALLQIDREEFSSLRMRVFAAVAESNQIRGFTENSKAPNAVNEAIILASILMDLRHLHQTPDPRRPLSAKSEYFLFQTVSEKAKGLMEEHVPPSVAALFEKLGWENIFDEIGLLPHFSNRLRKIRKEAGIPGTWFPKLSQWVLRLWKAPGDLPEYVGGGQYHSIIPGTFDKEGGMVQKWLSLLAYGRDTFLFDVGGLHLPSLQLAVQQELSANPILDSMAITPEIFKRDFLTYYSIAIGEWPYMQSWKDPQLPREKLLHFLHLRKGGWDKQTEVLMKHLEAVTAFPQIFHTTKELQTAFSSLETLEVYFSANNQKALYSHFCEKLLVPVTKHTVALNNAGAAVSTVKEKVVKMVPGSDLAQFALNATGHLAQDHATAALVNQGKALIEGERQSGTTIFSRDGLEQHSLADRNDAPFLAGFTAYGVFAAGWAAQNVVAGAVGLLPAAAGAAAVAPGIAAVAAVAVGTAAAKVAIAKAFNKPIGPRDILPGWAISSARWIKKGYKAYMSLPADPVIHPKQKRGEVPVDYRELQGAEDFFNGVFSTIYNHLFGEFDSPMKVGAWAPFALAGIENPKLQENQESLDAYYKWQAANPKPSIRMNAKGDLWGVTLALRSMYTSVSNSLKQEESALLAIFNREGLKPINLELLHALIEKNTLGDIGKALGLNDALLPDLALAIARIDHKRIRLQQLERVMLGAEQILHFSKEAPPEQQFAAVEKFALELRNKTPFDLKTTRSRLLRTFLTYQANTGVILWERQVNKIQDALKDPDESVVTILPPGMGKTTTINPLLGEILSDGEQIPAFIFPKSLAGDNMPQTHKVIREALGKVTYALSFNRDAPLDEKRLEGLLVLFNHALHERSMLQLTKEDALTLRMLLRDWLYAYNHERNCPITERQIFLLKELNRLVRAHVSSIPDEAHETYARRLRFNFPVGKDQGITPRRYKQLETAMRIVFNHPILREKVQKNEFVYLDEAEYTQLSKELFKQFCNHKILNVKDFQKLQEIEAFFLNTSQETPHGLKDNPELFEKVSMLKGVVNTLLKTNLKSQASVRFGVSSDPKDGEFIRPAAGNSAVMTNSMVQLPYETLVKTFVFMNIEGLTVEQTYKVVAELYKKAEQEAAKKACSIERTEIYQAFKEVISLEDLVLSRLKNDPVKLKKIQEAVNHPKNRSRFALLYTRFYIWKEIRYWKNSIEGNPQMFSNLFKRELAATGSPYNADTYPLSLNLRSDLAAQGEVLDIIRKKCPTGVVKTLATKAPKEVLNEILESYFPQGSTFQSLVDGGALLTGMANEEVAVQMLAFCEKNRPEIQAVRFFKPHPVTGQGALHVMKVGTRTALLAEEANLPASMCVDYNGQVEGFGANNCPAGDTLATVGPHHPLYRLIQEASRNRGLKRDQALKALGDHLIELKQQHIHFATILPVKEQIQKLLNLQDKDAELSIDELYLSAALNENEMNEDDLYGAGREMLQGILEAAIEDKALEASSFGELNRYFKAFEKQLIKTLEDDPIKLFGYLEGKAPAKKALEALAKQLYQVIDESSLFTDEEKDLIEKELFAVPNAPRFAHMKDVTVCFERKGGALLSGAADVVGIEQSVQVSNRQKTQQKNQNQNEQENQQEVQSDQQNDGPPRLKITRIAKILPWPTIADPTKTDWLKMSSPVPETSFRDYFRWKKNPVALEFYSVFDLMRQAKDGNIQAVASAFDKRLWMSSNFVERKGGRNPTEIGGVEQMRLHHVLVHAFEKPDGSYEIKHLGPLMVHETTQWKERLQKADWTHSHMKVFIWDPISQTVQGGYPAKTETLRQSADLKLLLGQLRFVDGSTKYKQQTEQMVAWLTKNDPELMESAFRTIHTNRGVKKLGGSHILEIFNRAAGTPVEDLIAV